LVSLKCPNVVKGLRVRAEGVFWGVGEAKKCRKGTMVGKFTQK